MGAESSGIPSPWALDLSLSNIACKLCNAYQRVKDHYSDKKKYKKETTQLFSVNVVIFFLIYLTMSLVVKACV
jgi:hypothetical protein